jgi:hypothetical protein
VPERRATTVLDGWGETIAVFGGHDDGLDLDGVLRVVGDEDGRVASVLLWLRPLDALLEGVERMRAALGRRRDDRAAAGQTRSTAPTSAPRRASSHARSSAGGTGRLR